MKKKDTYVPVAIEMKILVTVYLLNRENYFPLNEGVIKIIKGVVDKETLPFTEYETFSTISSYSAKKISRHIGNLLKHKFLTKRYYPQNEESYLAITNLGFNYVNEYKDKHKTAFKKTTSETPITIVKIDE